MQLCVTRKKRPKICYWGSSYRQNWQESETLERSVVFHVPVYKSRGQRLT